MLGLLHLFLHTAQFESSSRVNAYCTLYQLTVISYTFKFFFLDYKVFKDVI